MWQQSFVGFCYGEGTFQYFALTVHISVYMYIRLYMCNFWRQSLFVDKLIDVTSLLKLIRSGTLLL